MLTETFSQLNRYLNSQIIGQERFIENLLIALLADGHLLVEGPPGLAKTRAINALAKTIEGDFQRIQFTPDLLPSDLTGSDIYHQESGQFEFKSGPLFHNLILADEINRAPAKVQAALLEAMAEQQVTVGKTSYPLSDLFLVLATQNPLEQEGTYPLPEAQLDRFLMHLDIKYSGHGIEKQILRLTRGEAKGEADQSIPHLSQQDVFRARQEALSIYMEDSVEDYLVELVIATRESGRYDHELSQWIELGASPRATMALDRCARARAWLKGRDYVAPEDIQAVFPNVIRHRLILGYAAQAANISKEMIINRLLERVVVP